MDKYVTDEQLNDLQDCLSDKEKAKIDGKGLFGKLFKKIRDKKQAEYIEEYDAMIKNIEEDDISNIIPEEYKK
ncbi:MAG: hypothetical protein J6A15_04600 [Clostridia bacterium]|nr:hypothetical protein [Clostridia bacterium]